MPIMQIRSTKAFATAQRFYHRFRAMFLYEMWFPTYSKEIQSMIRWAADPVGRASIALALERIRLDGIPGAIAEIGVYRGETSKFLHQQAPERTLYLFDTFAGFPGQNGDSRFRDTSVELIKAKLGNAGTVQFRIGMFPQTASGLENEVFSFVLFDADKYETAIASLEFFYPRLSPGGCFLLHDFNSSESDWAVSRAVREFMRDKPECIIEVPDIGGTAMFRKSKSG